MLVVLYDLCLDRVFVGDSDCALIDWDWIFSVNERIDSICDSYAFQATWNVTGILIYFCCDSLICLNEKLIELVLKLGDLCCYLPIASLVQFIHFWSFYNNWTGRTRSISYPFLDFFFFLFSGRILHLVIFVEPEFLPSFTEIESRNEFRPLMHTTPEEKNLSYPSRGRSWLGNE